MKGKNHNGFSKGTVEERKLHNIYTHMTNKEHYKYKTYRCDEWEKEPMLFYEWAYENGFLQHIEKYGIENTTLDRINVDNHYYSPSNCRWATLKTQARNKTTTRWVEHDGKKLSLKEWCEVLNLKYKTIWARIKAGWDPLQALEIKPRKKWDRCA